MSALLPPSRAALAQRPLNRAAAMLLRLVMADGWRVEPAGRAMLALAGGDTQLLRLLHARVARAMLDRPTAADARALATLAQALDVPVATTPVRWSA